MEAITCSNCKSDLRTEDVFCSECGYPERGTDIEKNNFERRIILKKRVVKDAEKKVDSVRIMLYILAGLNIVIGTYYVFLSGDEFLFIDGIAALITGIVFIGCAIWVNNQPLTGVMAAFIFWIVLQILAAIVDPASIFSGILLKIVIIGVFIKGINSAKDAVKYSEQLASMKVK